MREHPLSIAFSNRISQKIDREVSRQNRSRSEGVELTFETLFFENLKTESRIATKTK
jgi:hypothetical protein